MTGLARFAVWPVHSGWLLSMAALGQIAPVELSLLSDWKSQPKADVHRNCDAGIPNMRRKRQWNLDHYRELDNLGRRLGATNEVSGRFPSLNASIDSFMAGSFDDAMPRQAHPEASASDTADWFGQTAARQDAKSDNIIRYVSLHRVRT